MGAPGTTPGPWPIAESGDGKRIIVGEGAVEGPNGYDVAEVYSDDCDRDEARANANQLAASPDLYDALEALANDVGKLQADLKSIPSLLGSLIEARMALAKARGEA